MFSHEFTTDDGTEVEFQWGYTRGDGIYFGTFTHYVEDDRPKGYEDDDVPPAWLEKATHLVQLSLLDAQQEGYRV